MGLLELYEKTLSRKAVIKYEIREEIKDLPPYKAMEYLIEKLAEERVRNENLYSRLNEALRQRDTVMEILGILLEPLSDDRIVKRLYAEAITRLKDYTELEYVFSIYKPLIPKVLDVIIWYNKKFLRPITYAEILSFLHMRYKIDEKKYAETITRLVRAMREKGLLIKVRRNEFFINIDVLENTEFYKTLYDSTKKALEELKKAIREKKIGILRYTN